MKDMVNHPPHYTDSKIETIEYIEDKKLGFHLGNAVKYISRAGKKTEDPVEDLEKAIWYIKRYIGFVKGETLCEHCKDGHCAESVMDVKCTGTEKEMAKCSFMSDPDYDDSDPGYDDLLWNVLRAHLGHRVEIAIYGDPADPHSVTLEDIDTDEVILDAGINTICAREDI